MKTNTMPKTNAFREHTLSIILDNCDLVTIKSDTGQPSLFLLHGSNPVRDNSERANDLKFRWNINLLDHHKSWLSTSAQDEIHKLFWLRYNLEKKI